MVEIKDIALKEVSEAPVATKKEPKGGKQAPTKPGFKAHQDMFDKHIEALALANKDKAKAHREEFEKKLEPIKAKYHEKLEYLWGAEKMASKAVAKDVHSLIGEIKIRIDNEKMAKASTAEKNEAKATYKKGDRLMEKGKWEEALSEYQKSQELYPHHNAKYKIALCLDQLDKREEALTFYKRYLNSDMTPEFKAKYWEGIANAKKRIKEIPKYAKLNKEDEAKMNEVEKENPKKKKDAKAAYDNGSELIKEGEYNKAIIKFKESQKLYPHYKGKHAIGFCLDKLGEKKKALKFYSRFINSDMPDDFKDEQKPAINFANKRIREIPKELKIEAKAAWNKGEQLFKKENYAEALPKFQESEKIYPFYTTKFKIGVCLDELGKKAEALTFYNSFINSDMSSEFKRKDKKAVDFAKNRIAGKSLKELKASA